MKKFVSLLLLLSVICINSSAQTTLLAYGATWKYLDNGTDQGTAWRGAAFNDASWASGPAQLGYGDGDEATTVSYGPNANAKYTTTYFRSTVNIPNVSAYVSFDISMLRDDGAIVYVNGTEVFRSNMPAGTVTYTTNAASNCSDDGNTIQTTNVSLAASQLVNGNNTIAVEIHQTNATSSDITMDLELVGLGVAPPTTITRGPYLQTGTPNEITLRWRTAAACDGKVDYGTSPSSLTSTVTVSGNVTEHTVTLTGLIPYTKYYYAIGTTAGVIQSGPDNYFVTSPLPGTEGKYTFWVTGDCGNNSTNQANCRNRFNTYMGTDTTNGWLLLGDNAYSSGTDGEFTSNFFNVYQGTIMKHATLWPAPGNHDYANSGARQDDHAIPYYDIFNVPAAGEAGGVASGTEAYYSYNYGNIHFISLDSYGEESNMRLYDTLGAQVTWLKQDLAANTLPWVICYWHHPPYTKGSHNSDTESDLAAMRTNFIRILERNGVDLILCGHSHDYERSKLMKGHYGNESSFNASTHNLSQSSGMYDGSANSCAYLKDSLHTLDGTVYIVSGSAGQLGGTQSGYPHNALPYADATHGGSLILEFNGNRLDVKWLCYDGIIRDQFTIFKDGSKVYNYTVNAGDTLTLSAAWNGAYGWSHSTETSQTVSIVPNASGTYYVTDQYACIADTFHVTVLFQTIDASANSITPVCAGSSFSISYTASGTFNAGNVFTAELSDSYGNFANPIAISSVASTTSGSIPVTIPPTTPQGNGYEIRITASAPAMSGTANTAPFTVTVASGGSITGLVNTYMVTDPAVTMTGNPAGGTFSGTGVSGNQFDPAAAGVGGPYTISYLFTDSMGCAGTTNFQVTVTLATAIAVTGSGNNIQVFPNPANEETTVAITLMKAEPVTIELFDLQGRVVMSQSLGTLAAGTNAVIIDRNALKLESGLYTLMVTTGNENVRLKMLFN